MCDGQRERPPHRANMFCFRLMYFNKIYRFHIRCLVRLFLLAVCFSFSLPESSIGIILFHKTCHCSERTFEHTHINSRIYLEALLREIAVVIVQPANLQSYSNTYNIHTHFSLNRCHQSLLIETSCSSNML